MERPGFVRLWRVEKAPCDDCAMFEVCKAAVPGESEMACKQFAEYVATGTFGDSSRHAPLGNPSREWGDYVYSGVDDFDEGGLAHNRGLMVKAKRSTGEALDLIDQVGQ